MIGDVKKNKHVQHGMYLAAAELECGHILVCH